MAAAPVPFFDLKTQYQGLRKQIEEAVNRVLQSGCFILGAEVQALEEEVAAYTGCASAIACASGTDALSLSLAALGVGPGDEVIVPTFTFFATASCVRRLGARPVFTDIDPDTFNMDPRQVEDKITPRTKAIIPVHLFGQCCDMEPLWKIAERYHLPIIEDAAQAFGSEYQGKRSGTLGTLACHSFYPTKNLGAYGDAGMVVTNDRDLAAKIACLRTHGMQPRYYHKYLGWNSRLDALQAAILRVKLSWVSRFIDARIAIARRYDILIDEHGLGGMIQKPVVLPHCKHTFNQYVIRVNGGRRDALLDHFRHEGIGFEVYYPIPLHLQEVFAPLGHKPGEFPVAERTCKEVVALPMYPELSYEQQKRVVRAIAQFARSSLRAAA
ncbi:MAG: DegT/DnrJ/EryC1/StrS family aminotransferase [Gemmatales bacterium]|nr:DegT/DnrJ/EryC1/StrS family aminotransferase [Gemmatales bacterium]MDW8387725.1 DegT/DnrJ/EryC1/StrS family aminotransferase [Gemmatales bacterium]